MPVCNLFISYSHTDVDFLSKLKEHINEEIFNLKIWDDIKVDLGDSWDNKIKTNIITADIILLLVSQSFLQSKYVRNVELDIALKRHKEGQCTVIPIFIRDCDLDDYTNITSLQGIPSSKKFLVNMPTEMDRYYAKLRSQVKKIAADKASLALPKLPIDRIEHLEKNMKIFVSVSDSKEANKRRNGFIYQVESKIKYEKWLYEIVPNISQAEEILKCPVEERRKRLEGYISDSVYTIHVFDDENINQELTNLQFELAKKGKELFTPFKSIIWSFNQEMKEKLDNELLTNPGVTGMDYESIFELIENLDIEKKVVIKQHRNEPQKKIYMFYDFDKDHKNPTRIKLKMKLESDHDISVVGRNLPEGKLSEEKKYIGECQGAVIFYGHSDISWYIKRQDTLLFESNIKRAVCIDEPDFKDKIERDIYVNAMTIIRGRGDTEFENDADLFINQVKKYSHEY